MRRQLEQVSLSDAIAAEERAREVVLEAFASREPLPPVRHRRRLLVVAVALLAAVGAAASPPGRAVVDRVREAVGVSRAQPALFSLPAQGRLLVASDGGLWIVRSDGSRRRLGDYLAGSWSPFGRFVVATRRSELVALDPDGEVRWSLARQRPRSAVWAGTRADTRIAYVDRTGIRVVAGDGTGDRLVSTRASDMIAWRPRSMSHLASASAGGVRVHDITDGSALWQARGPGEPIVALEWSSDGRLLLVLSAHRLRVYDQRGRVIRQGDPSDASIDVDAAFQPGTHEIAVIRRHGAQSTVRLLTTGASLFSGTGSLDQAVWSPDGQRLLIAWPTANQWVFVPTHGRRRLEAVANITAQFRGQQFPRVEAWCGPRC